MAQDAAGAVGARLNPQVDSLIRAVQRGDQDAFEQLVRAYDQSVLRLAMNLLRSPEDARDVYQEATRHRSEEHTSELQSHLNLVCRLLLEKKKKLQEMSIHLAI